MKYLAAALFMGAFFAFSPTQTAEAKGVIVYSSGDTIDLVEEISAELSNELGFPEPVDLGWYHFKFTLFWMPFFSGSDGHYVLFSGDSYYDLTDEEAAEFAQLAEIELPAGNPLPFYTQYWGWGVALVLLGGFGFYTVSKRDNEPIVS